MKNYCRTSGTELLLKFAGMMVMGRKESEEGRGGGIKAWGYRMQKH